MLRRTRFGATLYGVAMALGCLSSSGCSDSYPPATRVTPPAGSGANTGAVGSGSAGRSPGRAGSSSQPSTGGISGGVAGAPQPRSGTGGRGTAGTGPFGVSFSARLEGSSVILDVINPIDATYTTCSDAIVLEKLDVTSGLWSAPIDQRPPSYDNPGYYLDGVYVPPSFNEGCDVISCQNFGNRNFVAKAAEYVQVGMTGRANPDGSVTVVSMIETRPLIGKARVRVRYSLGDPMCRSTQEISIELDIPATMGVCCPVGATGCNSMGPFGGWALDSDSCPGRFPEYDVYYEQSTDSKGCTVLIEDPSECCGCTDAGVEE